MSNPSITSDSSNITVSNANLICDNDITANAFFDVNGIVLSGGGGGSSSDTLSDVVTRGNTTSDTITASGFSTTGVVTAGTFSGDGGTLSNLATVATTGAYGDLSGTPSIPTHTSNLTNNSNFVESTSLSSVATTGAYGDLSGTPTLSSVATTGAYGHLSGTPTLSSVATTGAYGDLSGTPTLSSVATTGAYSDLSGAPTSITALDVTDGTSGQFLTTDGSGTFTFTTVSASGSSNLQQVTDTGNITSNTLIFNGGFVTGNNATSVSATSNTLTIDMDGKSYNTFICYTANSIETISISNDILGSQGMIFLTATGDINILGTTSNLGGTNVNVSYDDISVSNGERALIGFMSDGTQRYINAAKYPSAGGGGGLSNLETITTNGNVATTTVQLTNSDVGLVATGNVQATYFIGDGSQLTNLPSGGGGGGTQAYYDVYDSTGNQTAPTGGVLLNLNTTRITSGNFTLSSDTIIFTKAGTYKVDFRVTTTVTSSTRSDSYAQLYKNNSLVAGSRVYMYNRLSPAGENTGAAAAIISMSSSDYISIKVFEESGATIKTVVNGSGVVITELLT